MSGKSSSASALILGLGVTAVFSISFLFYTFFWKTKSNVPKILPAKDKDALKATPSSDVTTSETTSEQKEVEETSQSASLEKATPQTTTAPVVVDDDEESDDEDDEASQLALKTAYDDALRLARKLLSGEKFFKAAEKFSEAIKLAEQLGGSASNDITTLYNNRSAMYEKCGELDLSLTDIGLVLAMEALHLKARIRRARIYEVQNKIKLSCIDYMVGMLIEMTKQQQPTHQEKIEALVKIQAVSESHGVVEAIRNSDNRALPSKSHCRNYFETFPSYHTWREMYTGATADRDTLAQAVTTAGGDFSEQDASSIEVDASLTARLEAIHALASFDIANGSFSKAFDNVNKACTFITTIKSSLADDPNTALNTVLANLFSIHGTYFHLRANFTQAKECFTFCLEKQPLPLGFENALRQASLHLEVDSLEEASEMYNSIAKSFSSEDSTDNAWLCVHRMSEWITRDEQGKFRSQGLEMATATITKALEMTKDFGNDPIKKSCRLMATLKLIQLLSQTKMQMGLQPDNNDLLKQKECIEEAISLFPNHDTVQMLNADLLSQEGKFDEALAHCDQMIKASEGPKDAILVVVKANVVCQMGMTKYSEAQQMQSQQLAMESQQLLLQGQGMYAEAIAAEPNCIEALIQLAQLKSMMGAGEMEEALALCNQALPHARNRDEALDIIQLKLMMENRLVAIQEMRDNGMQI